MDNKALYSLQYGVFLLGTKNTDGTKINACITNTCFQTANNPTRIAISVIKQNLTCEMIEESGVFALSILDRSCTFETIQRFGYQSGKDVNKFEDFSEAERSPNGILYITKNTNAYFSAYVKNEIDLGTHVLFIAQLVASEALSDETTLTYDFYQKNIKPKPQQTAKKGWRCKICGFVYEESILPDDYICPICKHGAQDFEKLY